MLASGIDKIVAAALPSIRVARWEDFNQPAAPDAETRIASTR
jgi:hypothetical protein